MVATQPTLDMGSMSQTHEIAGMNNPGRTLHSIDEFADRLGKKLGQHYGLNDIRELL